MGSVDKTIFTLNHDTDFLLVQIYVDDIIFGGSSHTLVSRFQEIIESEFQMSMMGELTFFLGIQVKQTKQGTFMHQAKYTKDLMKKFNMAELKTVSTPMSSTASLGPEHDRLPPVPHSDTAGHLVHRGAVRALSVFPTLFTTDGSSASLQVSQTHS
jgi:hypothetical protein